jgi:hypothetical protein
VAGLETGKPPDLTQAVSPWVLVTRLDPLEIAKVDPSTTWDALIELCHRLRRRGPPRQLKPSGDDGVELTS